MPNRQDSKNAIANTVSAENQVSQDRYVQFFYRGGKKRVLFVGNSITHHMPNPSIGWYGDCGMAATSKETDFVHVVLRYLDGKYGCVDYAVVQAAYWEKNYDQSETLLSSLYAEAKEFDADIIIIRIGENARNKIREDIDFASWFTYMIDFFQGKNCKELVISDLFWYKTYNHIFQEEAARRGCKFVHLTDLEEEEGTMALGLFEHKGVEKHPSDYGMKRIAERIIEQLETSEL